MDNTAIVAVCLGAAFFLIMGASLLWSRKKAFSKHDVYVSPERKQAMIEAGVWDDPTLRAKYLKAYQQYDMNKTKSLFSFWPRKRQERVAERMREKLGFREMHLATGEKVRVIKPPLEHLRKHSPVDACAQASKPKKRGRPKNSKNKPRKRTAKRTAKRLKKKR